MPEKEISKLNKFIRKSIIQEGRFHIVETRLNGEIYLRTTLMNPFTKKKHLVELLNKIEETANKEIDNLSQ